MQEDDDGANPSSLANSAMYDSELRKAITDGDSERFEELLNPNKDSSSSGIDLSKWLPIDKPTLLQHVCQNGAIFATDALIKSGIDPNQTSKKSSLPPLLEAASRGDIQILKLLTEHCSPFCCSFRRRRSNLGTVTSRRSSSFFLVFGGKTTDNSTGKEGESAIANVQDSLLKVLPMMIGEFDFGSLPLDLNPVTSRLIFVTFLFLITIVLLNFLNGLAVSDTQEFQSKVEILCYVSRVELISYVESVLLGDSFEFLDNWPPFAVLRCFIFIPILRVIHCWAFINGFIPARRAMLFYDCLPNKTLTVFPTRKIN